jgi:5-methylcytosine-specific restriction protein A
MRQLRPLVRAFDGRVVKQEPKRADAELLTAEAKRFRYVVRSRAGWRCQWVEDGQRCKRSSATGDLMIADHIIERADGGALYDPANGCCLCTAHNTLKGVRARAKRAAG